MSGRVLSAEEVEALAGLDCWDAELIPDLLATVVYGREQVLRLTRERDTLAEGCCVDCGGSGVGPDACDAGDHFTPSCHSCGGTGMSPTVRRVVKERDEARAEVERLRAERDTPPAGCCADCGGSGAGPDSCEAGDHCTPPCPSCDGTGLSPEMRRVVRERNDARVAVLQLQDAFGEAHAELERLRAELAAAQDRPRVHDPAGCAVMSAGQLCLRCCKPMATAADHDEYEAHVDADHPPNGWTDREGSHLCWRGVGGQCLPFGDSLRITSGHLVLHDGSTLLSVPLEQVRVLLAGVP